MTLSVEVEESSGVLLVGVDGDEVSASLSIGPDADSDDVEEAVADLLREGQHSTRLLGRDA